MKAIKAVITSFIDNHQPGYVECRFIDVHGKEHIVHEKVPIVTDKDLDENSLYPQDGVIACEIIGTSKGEDGRTILTVNTANPWAVETTEGLAAFDLFEEQVIDFNW